MQVGHKPRLLHVDRWNNFLCSYYHRKSITTCTCTYCGYYSHLILFPWKVVTFLHILEKFVSNLHRDTNKPEAPDPTVYDPSSVIRRETIFKGLIPRNATEITASVRFRALDKKKKIPLKYSGTSCVISPFSIWCLRSSMNTYG